jgi:hypothetical protein
MTPEGSFWSSNQPAIEPYHYPAEFNPNLHTLFLHVPFNSITLPTLTSPKLSLSRIKTFYAFPVELVWSGERQARHSLLTYLTTLFQKLFTEHPGVAITPWIRIRKSSVRITAGIPATLSFPWFS